MLNAYFGANHPVDGAARRRGAPGRRRRGDGDLQQGRRRARPRRRWRRPQVPSCRRRRPRWRGVIPSGRCFRASGQQRRGARRRRRRLWGHRKHGVVGDTVNLASRLESEAPVGEVVMATLRQATRCSSRSGRRLRVKGKAEPVQGDLQLFLLAGRPRRRPNSVPTARSSRRPPPVAPAPPRGRAQRRGAPGAGAGGPTTGRAIP